MPVSVIEPPAAVLTLAEVKKHLRVEHDDDDDLIDGCLAAAQGHIDGPDGWLGRSIGLQTLETSGDVWPDPWGRILLPFPPLVDVVSIVDASGAEAGPAVYAAGSGGMLSLKVGQAWPWSCWGGVKIRYNAGYSNCPAPIRSALQLIVADLYEYRAGKVADTLVTNPTVKALLTPYRAWAA